MERGLETLQKNFANKRIRDMTYIILNENLKKVCDELMNKFRAVQPNFELDDTQVFLTDKRIPVTRRIIKFIKP